MDVVIVAAIASNGVIGADGDLPWQYPADLQHFKKLTMGSPVIMGRRTYESIVDRLDGPLPGRTNIVLTRGVFRPDHEDVHVVGSIDEGLATASATEAETAFVIGGRSIYRQVLDRGLADRLVITRIPDRYEGDTYWPGPDLTALDATDRTPIGDGLEVVTYQLA